MELVKPIGKKSLDGRPRRRGEDTIRIKLKELFDIRGNWIDSAQDRDFWKILVNAALNLQIP